MWTQRVALGARLDTDDRENVARRRQRPPLRSFHAKTAETDAAAQTFRQLYDSNYTRLVAYALRRATEEDAADVVAETFLVAWRDLDRVPEGPEATPWLFGIARRVLANQRRGAERRSRLAQRIGYELRTKPVTPSSLSDDLVVIAEALAELSFEDQEVLGLSAWEGLGPAQLSIVLGCSVGAAKVRLSRARKRLAASLEHRDSADLIGRRRTTTRPAGASISATDPPKPSTTVEKRCEV